MINETLNSVLDPVCGMQIDPNNAAAQSTYQGKTYYFSSEKCKNSFDKDPEKYTKNVQEPQHHR